LFRLNNYVHNYSFFDKIFNKYLFKKLVFLLINLFSFKKNLLFVDLDTNYNYLPINNNIIFNRSSSKLYKLIKYFDVALIFYINLKKKKFIFKKLYSCNVLNVSLSNNFVKDKFDLHIDIKNKLTMYMFYLFVLNFYIKVKNKI
jgi:hypothetical protein